MPFSFEMFLECLKAGAHYIPVTVEITLISYIASIVLGMLIAILRSYRVPVISQILAAFITVYRGVPVTVALVVYNLLFMTYYAKVTGFLGIKIPLSEVNLVIIGYFGMILTYSCYISEGFRGAFLSVDKLQFEAGYSVGLTKTQTFFRIILPQMIPAAAPILVNMLIGCVKSTNLVSVLGVTEVMGGSILPGALSYRFLEGYLAAAVIYWLIGSILEFIARRIETYSGRYRRQAI